MSAAEVISDALQVLQFVVDAVKAEAFNPRTLFLFGTYTIGKEKLFLEVARALNKKVTSYGRWVIQSLFPTHPSDPSSVSLADIPALLSFLDAAFHAS